MEKEGLEESVIVRISRRDKDGIRRVSSRLSLSQSEIMRRALRLGLGELDDAKLPGAMMQLRKPSGAHGS